MTERPLLPSEPGGTGFPDPKGTWSRLDRNDGWEESGRLAPVAAGP